MENVYSIAKLLSGFILLYFGAESLIRGGASFALRIGLPMLVISLTIIAYGTSMPELVVSVEAALAEKGDIALGNVIGSNIANIGFILGLSALIRPIKIKSQLIQFDGPLMVVSALILCLLIFFSNPIGRIAGFFLLIGQIFHTYFSVQCGKKETEEDLKLEKFKYPLVDILLIVVGLLLLFGGGKWFLSGAIELATYFNISDAVIGLTVVALGTSLPEFATSIVAVSKKHGDIVVGNIIGSNIFNILAIIGLGSILKPISIREIQSVDYIYMAILTIFFWLIIQNRTHITRFHGAIMLSSYIAYIIYLASL